jgi:hypothetical protein
MDTTRQAPSSSPRIVNLVCAITAIGFLITWFPRLFSLGPVAFLGRHSLHVFVC